MEIWIILGFLTGFVMMTCTSYISLAEAAVLVIAAILSDKLAWPTGLSFIAGMLLGLFIDDSKNHRRISQIVISILVVLLTVLAFARII